MTHKTNVNATMMRTLIVLATVLALVASALLQARAAEAQASSPAGDGQSIDKGKAEKAVSDREAEKALEFWTKERMKNAKPVKPELPGRPDNPPGGERSSEKAPRPEGPAKTIPGSLPKQAAKDPSALLAPATADSPTTATHNAYPFPYTSGYVGLSYYNSYPNTTFGKIFFVEAGVPRVCSGTVVNSANKSMVWTAGHCVQKNGLYHSNVIFVPSYKDGYAPFGRWPARIIQATPGWASSNDLNYDLGAIVVRTSSTGVKLADRVGSLGLGWNRAYQQTWKSTGFPAQYPFNGERMYRCNAETATLDYSLGSPATMGIGCNMTGGASGGGWAVGLSGYGGTVLSVNSYKYLGTQPNAMYGPYQGTAAANLYNGLTSR